MRVVATESQLEDHETLPRRVVNLDLYDDENECSGSDSCACSTCSGPASLLGAAACAMFDASNRSKPKTRAQRLGAQCMHWGVLFVGLLVSMPALVGIMTEPIRDWTRAWILADHAWALALGASALFACGFVSKLGRERVVGGCAMIRRLGPAAILGVAWSTLPSFAGVLLVLNMEPIRIALIGDSGLGLALGVSIYIGAFVILAGLGCLPTVSQAILAGYAFGLELGFGAAILGFGGASLIGYELVRRFAAPRVEREIQSSTRAVMIRDALLRASPIRSVLLIALLRSSPSSPFALTNLLLGSLGVNRWVFFVGTIIGMTPRTLAAVFLGLTFTGYKGGFDQPVWLVTLGVVAIVALIIAMTRISAVALKRAARTDSAPTPALV